MKKSTNFFAVSEYKFANFDSMQSEIDQIDQIGKIRDNSDFKMRQFERLPLIDDESLAKNEVPHYFQTAYIPDDKFLVIGGLERETNITSSRCFMIDEKGKLSVMKDMNVGRQYMTICSDQALDLIYVIGGFNSQSGILASFETFNIRARKW